MAEALALSRAGWQLGHGSACRPVRHMLVHDGLKCPHIVQQRVQLASMKLLMTQAGAQCEAKRAA